MAFLLLLENILNEHQRIELNLERRRLRDASDPLNLPLVIFKGIYRVSKEVAYWLVNEIAPFMKDPVRVAIFLPKKLRIFCTLHFLAHGSDQKGIAQDLLHPMCQASVSNSLREVVPIIVQTLGHLISFPNTRAERQRVKEHSDSECSHVDATPEDMRLQPPTGFSDSRELSEAECDRDFIATSKLPNVLATLLARYQEQKEQERKEFTIHV